MRFFVLGAGNNASGHFRLYTRFGRDSMARLQLLFFNWYIALSFPLIFSRYPSIRFVSAAAGLRLFAFVGCVKMRIILKRLDFVSL